VGDEYSEITSVIIMRFSPKWAFLKTYSESSINILHKSIRQDARCFTRADGHSDANGDFIPLIVEGS
jgi:hypothetical protein